MQVRRPTNKIPNQLDPERKVTWLGYVCMPCRSYNKSSRASSISLSLFNWVARFVLCTWPLQSATLRMTRMMASNKHLCADDCTFYSIFSSSQLGTATLGVLETRRMRILRACFRDAAHAPPCQDIPRSAHVTRRQHGVNTAATYSNPYRLLDGCRQRCMIPPPRQT